MEVGASSRHRVTRGRAGVSALLVLLAVGQTTCATTGIGDLSQALPARAYTLPSGLRVVIEEDPAATLVGVAWTVDTGAVDDPPHRRELAHTVEHLLFELPDGGGVSPWRRLRDLGAIDIDGSTSLERTVLHAFVPRAELDRLVALELDRMAHPLGTADDGTLEAEMAKQRSVVDEERNVREDAAGGEGRLLFMRLYPATHPYAAAFAAPAEADAPLTAEEARRFVRDHYQPQRMTLVLSGAVPAGWEARLWAMMPPALAGDRAAPRAPQRRPLVPSPPPTVPGPEMVTLPARTALSRLWIGWWLPAARGLDAVPLKILGEVVEYALKTAIDAGELDDALEARATTVTGDQGSALVCVLVLRDGGRAEQARARVVEIVTRRAFSRLVVYGAAQRATLKWVALSATLRLQSLPERTVRRAELAHDDAGADLGALVATVNRVSDGYLSQLARMFLTPAASRSILQRQADGRAARGAMDGRFAHGGPERDVDAGLVHPAAVAEAALETTAAHTADEVRAAATAAPVGGARIARLANGLTVIALRRPGLPFVSMVLGFHSAPVRDAPPGIWLAARFGRQYENIWGALERGILAQDYTDTDDVREELTTYTSRTGEALGYLSDKARTLYLRWPDDAFERWSYTALAEEKTLDARVRRRFAAALWGNHVYGLEVPSVQVMAHTQDEVGRWIDRVERGDNGALVVVGDVDPEDVVRRADGKLGDAWTDRKTKDRPVAAPPVPAPRPSRPGPPPIQFTQSPNRRAGSIHFGCFLPPARSLRDGVVGDLLAHLMEQQLFQRLRVHEGKSYAPAVVQGQLWGGTSVLDGTLDIDDDAVGKGVDAVQELLREDGPPAFDATAIERVRWQLALSNATRFSSNTAIARALFAAWKLGWQPSALDEVPADLAGVGAPDLQAALRVCRASAVVSVVSALGAAVP